MRIVRTNSADDSAGRRQHIPSKTPEEVVARRIAVEKANYRLFKLDCGHFTDLATDLQYSHWRPRKGVSYCESCSKWRKIPPPYKSPPLPDEPMF